MVARMAEVMSLTIWSKVVGLEALESSEKWRKVFKFGWNFEGILC